VPFRSHSQDQEIATDEMNAILKFQLNTALPVVKLLYLLGISAFRGVATCVMRYINLRLTYLLIIFSLLYRVGVAKIWRC